MLGPPDLNRVGTRRILTCPYCDQLQSIIPRPATLIIGCRKCHRASRVIETGAGRAAVRADDPAILPIGRPGRCPIDRRSEPAGGTTEQAPPRSHGGRSREMLPWLRAPWVFP